MKIITEGKKVLHVTKVDDIYVIEIDKKVLELTGGELTGYFSQSTVDKILKAFGGSDER